MYLMHFIPPPSIIAILMFLVQSHQNDWEEVKSKTLVQKCLEKGPLMLESFRCFTLRTLDEYTHQFMREENMT